MNTKIIPLAMAAVLLAPCAHAVVASANASYSVQGVAQDDAAANFSSNKTQYAYKTDGSNAQVSAVSPALTQSVFGVIASSYANVGSQSGSANHRTVWSPNAAVDNKSLNVSSGGDLYNGWSQSKGGWVRFKVDYDLFANGPDASAFLSFNGYGTQAFSAGTQSNNGYFYKRVAGTADGAEEHGTWYSDWLYFSGQSAIDAVQYPWEHNQSVGYNYTLNTLSYLGEDGLAIAGTTAAGANLNVSWEVTPVPEPETYALFAAGLAAVALARRKTRA